MFENIFNNIDNWELDEAEFERIKSKMCNSYLKPILPSSKGFSQFMDTLYGVTDEMRRNNRVAVFNAKLSDVVAAGKELCKNAQDSKSVIIFSKTEENAGKIVDLHL
jgi:Zn-dependent M16 (insulinase) family peptidase